MQGASCKPLGNPPPSSFLLRLNYCLYDVTDGSIFSPMVPALLDLVLIEYHPSVHGVAIAT